METVARWPLFVAEDGSLTLQSVLAKARLLIRQEKLGLIVIDYVQLISAPGAAERDRITKISGQLRALAKDTGVPMVLISQLSRPKDRNANERPNKFCLKESGSLENDANTILLIYRPVDDLGNHTREDEIIVAKQRSGPVGIERVVFDPSTLVFRERTRASAFTATR
jgi:replicative DNA helicase